METIEMSLCASQGNRFLEIGEAILEIDFKLKEIIFFQGGLINEISFKKSDSDLYQLSGGLWIDQNFKATVRINNLNYTTLVGYIEEINIILNN